MLESFILCAISVFSVAGIILTVKYITDAIINCSQNPGPTILIGIKNKEESIEGMVRVLMRKFPYSEIIIVDYGSTDDTVEIIKKLAKDYARIGYKTKNSKNK